MFKARRIKIKSITEQKNDKGKVEVSFTEGDWERRTSLTVVVLRAALRLGLVVIGQHTKPDDDHLRRNSRN